MEDHPQLVDPNQSERFPVEERFFYHSFPRRGVLTPEEITKGCKILAAIRDFGLLLTPQYIEWKQPTVSGEPRIFPVLQKRVCFTELIPRELKGHAQKFGNFALEFEIDVVRRLGAIPVFYVPQPSKHLTDGSAIGTVLLGIAMDAHAVISRMACLDQILHGTTPVAEKFGFQPGFARSPDGRGDFTLDRDEATRFLAAIGHAVTPWHDLSAGMFALLNFFHPTDNEKADRAMEYYREREWRIACGFRLNQPDGPPVDVLHAPTPEERGRFLEIDNEFFSRQIVTDTGTVDSLDAALVHPGLPNKRIMEMVRRVIVPRDAVAKASEILGVLSKPPSVVANDDLP